jgi:hypothetical protein
VRVREKAARRSLHTTAATDLDEVREKKKRKKKSKHDSRNCGPWSCAWDGMGWDWMCVDGGGGGGCGLASVHRTVVLHGKS